MTLSELKEFCRIDSDITDDDTLITELGTAAQKFMTEKTGKTYDDDDALHKLVVKQIVACWYDNRQAITQGSTSEVPYTIECLLIHISHASEVSA